MWTLGDHDMSLQVNQQLQVSHPVRTLIMEEAETITGKYSPGLRDDIWQWLQQDLSHVDKNSIIMICSHNPMFMDESGRENYLTARHGQDTHITCLIMSTTVAARSVVLRCTQL